MELAEKNYNIHNKQLLTVVEVFKHWRPYCNGSCFPILVFTNHQNLRYFTTSKVLNQRPVHQAEILSECNCQIVWRAGSRNRKKDVLTWHLEYVVEGRGASYHKDKT
jgi:hypothetical protein